MLSFPIGGMGTLTRAGGKNKTKEHIYPTVLLRTWQDAALPETWLSPDSAISHRVTTGRNDRSLCGFFGVFFLTFVIQYSFSHIFTIVTENVI